MSKVEPHLTTYSTTVLFNYCLMPFSQPWISEQLIYVVTTIVNPCRSLYPDWLSLKSEYLYNCLYGYSNVGDNLSLTTCSMTRLCDNVTRPKIIHKNLKSVINISILSPTKDASNICHQTQCNQFIQFVTNQDGDNNTACIILYNLYR